ncbi:hypothetical protein AQUCO_00201130v1 [Aquilegia coerulea]|uniref:Uncharacterized protein n=1 Tax=Aquilegia coerulea TaxID=218851 RepID=A0A2G5F6G1_AQUCA|nr:hypothetical protein AQUCO_00201130v1 [Aquilegia coerulea]
MDSYPSAIPNQLPIKSVPGQWTTGLHDCCDDPSSCLLTCCCPCITFGQIAEIIDEGTTSWNRACCIYYSLSSCSWLYASMYRSKLRRMYSLREEPCSDGVVHCCCCVCSITQEYWELKARGLDPSKGWQANLDRCNQDGSKVPPVVASSMDR